MTENTKKEVAIVVPYPGHDGLTAGEKTSLFHLNEVLGRYDKFVIFPDHGDSTPSEYLGMPVMRTPTKYFGSIEAHGELLFSQMFYSWFLEYRYILIYHLDSLVFRDELLDWCKTGLDYVGPPWIMGPDLPWLKNEGVGNGGFSLRKVESFLGVIEGWNMAQRSRERRIENGVSRIGSGGAAKNLLRSLIRRIRRIGKPRKQRIPYGTGVNEDRFWERRAKEFFPDFRIPSVEKALEFGFEANPRLCLERNGGKLPFGCHAWERYDRDFWKPYLMDRKPETDEKGMSG